MSSCYWSNGKIVYSAGRKSTFFSTYGLNYTKVCGQVRGYQYGYPCFFLLYKQ